MDTRAKILTETEALHLRSRCQAIVGFFDPLLAAHVRRLNELARPDLRLLAVIADPQAPLLHLRARAELVASLAIIDFVIPVTGDPLAFLQRLAPAETADDRIQDRLRTAQLIEHVQRQYKPE